MKKDRKHTFAVAAAHLLLLAALAVCFSSACATVEEDAGETGLVEREAALPDAERVDPESGSAREESETAPGPAGDDNEVVVTVDSVGITKHEFEKTKSEIEVVVEDLNKITETQNYDAWLAYLDPDYRKTLTDRAYLDRVSKSLPRALQERKIRLLTLEDYFKYVFVPSRQNIRVDDIQFITPTRVYVIMEISHGQTAAVYILEKNQNGEWKLVDKN